MKKKKIEDKSTILLDKEVISLLQGAKEYPRQTYNELIKKMVILYTAAKEKISEEKEKEEEKINSEIEDYMEKNISKDNSLEF